ncbi:MAG TPA: tail fiber domain-containing protein [Blastocatellia bacterium]|nr:tail fiber domain-containing protein [Blastocatellia bacterium]
MPSALLRLHLYAGLLVFLISGFAFAQEVRPASASPVLAAASTERLRLVAPGEVFQLRLEVFTPAGEKLFDSDARFGNQLDWNLLDQQGQRLADGAYRCLVTARTLDGRLSRKQGIIVVQAGQLSLQASDQNSQAIQSANRPSAVSQQDSWTVVSEATGLPLAFLAHDGERARVMSGRGGLAFHTGDFLAGRDAEQMRLTAEGNLGLGVTDPQARLDVAGLIRTSEGIVFPDGTIQRTAAGAGAARDRQTALDSPAGSAIRDRLAPGRTIEAGSGEREKAGKEMPGPNRVNVTAGTANRIVKFAADGATLVDSTVTEAASGDIGIGTTTPGGVFDLQRSSGGDILQRLWNTGSGGAKLRYVAATGATSQLQLTDGLEWLMAIAGNNSVGMQFRLRPPGSPNTEAQLNASAAMTISRNGNVGIGTASPFRPLHIKSTGEVALNIEGDSGSPDMQIETTVSNIRRWTFGSTGNGHATPNAFYIYQDTNTSNAPIQTTRLLIDQSGNVGINTTSPQTRLHIQGNNEVLRLQGTTPYLQLYNSLGTATGYFYQKNLNDAEVGISTANSQGHLFFTTQGTERMRIYPASEGGDVEITSRLGIGTIPDEALDVNGAFKIEGNGHYWKFDVDNYNSDSTGYLFLWRDGIVKVYISDDGSYHTSSDLRLKTDIKPYHEVLNGVKNLGVSTFLFKNNPDSTRRNLGVIAQDVQKYFPEIVGQQQEKDGNEYLSLDYSKLGVIAVKAIQEQQELIEKLERRIADLEQKPADRASLGSSAGRNLCDGVVVLDQNGEAIVNLPDSFEALNRDFRYQLTAIGAPARDLYIAAEIADHHFRIAGGRLGMKVSWQVTGYRQDPASKTHPMSVGQ